MNTLAFERLLAMLEAVVDELRDLNDNMRIIKDLLNVRLNPPQPTPDHPTTPYRRTR